MEKKIVEVGENCKALWETIDSCLIADGKKKSVSWLGNEIGIKPKTVLSQRDNNRTPDWEQIGRMFKALGKKIVIVPSELNEDDLQMIDRYSAFSDEDRDVIKSLVNRLSDNLTQEKKQEE